SHSQGCLGPGTPADFAGRCHPPNQILTTEREEYTSASQFQAALCIGRLRLPMSPGGITGRAQRAPPLASWPYTGRLRLPVATRSSTLRYRVWPVGPCVTPPEFLANSATLRILGKFGYVTLTALFGRRLGRR